MHTTGARTPAAISAPAITGPLPRNVAKADMLYLTPGRTPINSILGLYIENAPHQIWIEKGPCKSALPVLEQAALKRAATASDTTDVPALPPGIPGSPLLPLFASLPWTPPAPSLDDCFTNSVAL